MLQPDGKQGQVLFARTTGWGPHLAHTKGLGGGGGGGLGGGMNYELINVYVIVYQCISAFSFH